ncbi:hypothetical protein C84B14_03731 [Salinisphaera sp. C84B14]|uniref:antitoxin n=1 Tax=Salinisphaera sp. C84B14 TaxID=1304155 RepID=UPI003341DA87
MNNESALTDEEKQILESYERGEFESVLTAEMRQGYVRAARRTFKKDKHVNVRMSGKDLELLQARALREGVPYQTLISSIIHKFVTGRLTDHDAL